MPAGHQPSKPVAGPEPESLFCGAFRLVNLGRVDVEGTPLRAELPSGIAVHDAGELAPPDCRRSKRDGAGEGRRASSGRCLDHFCHFRKASRPGPCEPNCKRYEKACWDIPAANYAKYWPLPKNYYSDDIGNNKPPFRSWGAQFPNTPQVPCENDR